MNYFPVLLSKSGEETALSWLTPNVKSDISPIIQVIDNLPEASLSAIWDFNGNQILIDFSLYAVPFIGADIQTFFEDLYSNGVNAVPVIQENSHPDYITVVRYLIATYGCKVAIRISSNSGGLNNYNAIVAKIMLAVGIAPQATILIIDLGYVNAANYGTWGTIITALILAIPNRIDYDDIVVTAGSFLENLTPLPVQVAPHRLRRYEWDIWQQLQANADLQGTIKYGDYGTKNPTYVPVNYSGSCSIKYTVQNEFVIYRGERAQDHANGNGQYITLAGRLIATPDYSGIGFSRGDREIDRIANEVMTNPKKKPGSATTWVQISQNHHITLLHSLL